jgi:hypothetical protein
MRGSLSCAHLLEIRSIYAGRRGKRFHREIEESSIGLFVICDTAPSSLRWTLRVKRLYRSFKIEITSAKQLQSANPSPIMVHVHDNLPVLFRRGSRLAQIDRKLLITFDFEREWNHGRTMLQRPLSGQLFRTGHITSEPEEKALTLG